MGQKMSNKDTRMHGKVSGLAIAVAWKKYTAYKSTVNVVFHGINVIFSYWALLETGANCSFSSDTAQLF